MRAAKTIIMVIETRMSGPPQRGERSVGMRGTAAQASLPSPARISIIFRKLMQLAPIIEDTQ
jgi:hypothetical protein